MSSLYNEYVKGYNLCMEQIQNILIIDLKLNLEKPDNLPEDFVSLMFESTNNNESLNLQELKVEAVPFKVSSLFINQVNNLLELAKYYRDQAQKQNIIDLRDLSRI